MSENKEKKSIFGRKKKAQKINYSPGEAGAKKNLVFIIGAAISVVFFAAAIFILLSSMFSTENYYVLNTNVRAKQEITAEMVEPRETAAGTAPVHSLSMEDIQRGGVFSRYPLYAGDVVAKSNAGPLAGSTLGIPDDWVVTSFSINSTDAVGGTLGKGDYVDLLGIKRPNGEESDESDAQYIFNNLLILDVKFINEEYDGMYDGQTIVGETMHYTVGLPADRAAYLHSALDSYSSIKIIKAPLEINYADRNVSDLDEAFRYGPETGNMDVMEGTDPTFTEVERDKDGRPVSKNNNANQDVDEDDYVPGESDNNNKEESDEVSNEETEEYSE